MLAGGANAVRGYKNQPAVEDRLFRKVHAGQTEWNIRCEHSDPSSLSVSLKGKRVIYLLQGI